MKIKNPIKQYCLLKLTILMLLTTASLNTHAYGGLAKDLVLGSWLSLISLIAGFTALIKLDREPFKPLILLAFVVAIIASPFDVLQLRCPPTQCIEQPINLGFMVLNFFVVWLLLGIVFFVMTRVWLLTAKAKNK